MPNHLISSDDHIQNLGKIMFPCNLLFHWVTTGTSMKLYLRSDYTKFHVIDTGILQ